MQFCNICVKNSEQLKRINEGTVKSGGNVLKIKCLLEIFRYDIVKFLLDDKEAFICEYCIKELKKCFEFVQRIKEECEKSLNTGKENQTEHDCLEAIRNDDGIETPNKKVTVCNETVPEMLLNRCKEFKTEHDYLETIRNNDGNETSIDRGAIFNEGFDKHLNLDTNKSLLSYKPILPKTTSTTLVDKNVGKSVDIKSRLYKCLRCTEYFKSYTHLNEHEKEFCKNKYVKYIKVCKFCHKCYSNENFLREHVSSIHPQREYLCCLCEDKLFTAKGYLSRHIQKVHQHESLQFFCGECTDILCLPSQEKLREHFLHSHPHEDQAKTNSNDEDMDLEMHEEFLDEFLLAHTNENSFQFSECWEALDLHLPDMLQEGAANINNAQEFTQAFSCPKCYEQFKNPQPLLKHLADIHDLPVLICRLCSKSFTSFNDFKRHKLQKCPKNSAMHSITLECPYCSKKFKNNSNLKQHLRVVHCQLKKHICQLCDKQFSTLDHLKKHVLSQHQNERKHSCTVCNKKFTQLGHLKQHFTIHTTGKTIQCSECSSKFWRKIDLERHRQKNHVPAVTNK